MHLLIGAVLALVVGAAATAVGLDRDRAFYPVVAMVVGSYYVLFAAMAASPVLGLEAAAMALFVALAVAGFKRSLWLAVAALAGHGLFDLVHGRLIANPGVPVWWPAFCSAYDVAAAAYLAGLLLRRGSSR